MPGRTFATSISLTLTTTSSSRSSAISIRSAPSCEKPVVPEVAISPGFTFTDETVPVIGARMR